MHIIHKTIPTYEYDYTDNFDTHFRPLPEPDLRKIRLLAPHTILNEGPPPDFQIMVANGQLEASIATVELQFEVGDITFREKFLIMTNLTSPLIGLLFLQRNHTRYASRKPELSLLFNAIEK